MELWEQGFTLIAWVLVLEGLLPFACPQCWRRWMLRLLAVDEQTLRWIGLAGMLVGAWTLYLLRANDY